MVQKGIDEETFRQAQILWDYLKLNQSLQKTDCVIAMGSHDLRVAEYAARLFLDGWAPLLVCSGGLGRLTKELWREPEARKFAQIAIEMGVPAEMVLIEDKSTNTAENLDFSRKLLAGEGIKIKSAILVHKPYMERRALATAGVVWPELSCVIASPPIKLHDYPTSEITLREVIQIMVGDFQRLIVYPEKGFQIPQEIPSEVFLIYNSLISKGFNKSLVKGKKNSCFGDI